MARPALQPGTLWARLLAQTDHALRCGALQPIPTADERIEQNGIHFILRILASLARKDQVGKAQSRQAAGAGFNPFLPYEEDLFVADISATHLCLLNKFNVLDHHLLIVTREFEEQENRLNLEDFAALWTCMAEFEALAFYNSGRIAGASQPHKHLQMVPLPLAPAGPGHTYRTRTRRRPFRGSCGNGAATAFRPCHRPAGTGLAAIPPGSRRRDAGTVQPDCCLSPAWPPPEPNPLPIICSPPGTGCCSYRVRGKASNRSLSTPWGLPGPYWCATNPKPG